MRRRSSIVARDVIDVAKCVSRPLHRPRPTIAHDRAITGRTRWAPRSAGFSLHAGARVRSSLARRQRPRRRGRVVLTVVLRRTSNRSCDPARDDLTLALSGTSFSVARAEGNRLFNFRDHRGRSEHRGVLVPGLALQEGVATGTRALVALGVVLVAAAVRVLRPASAFPMVRPVDGWPMPPTDSAEGTSTTRANRKSPT